MIISIWAASQIFSITAYLQGRDRGDGTGAHHIHLGRMHIFRAKYLLMMQ